MSLLKRKSNLPRLIAICALLSVTGWIQPRMADAGCHYRHGAQGRADSDQDDSRGHVRNFRFLGQWVYEAGQVKYVRWQAEGKCTGPNCHADNDPLPVNGATSAVDSNRSHTTLMYSDDSRPKLKSSLCFTLALQNVEAFRGYPHAIEYPP